MAKLIVLEGADGAGKSTQVKLIKKYFEDKGLKFAFFHFPMYEHNEFSDVIAKFLRGEFGGINEVSPWFVANIYAMDRFMFMPDLQKALDENDVVLLDRYVYSNVAYQAAKFPLASMETHDIKNWILNFEFDFLKLPYPDLNIFFDVPSSVSKKRIEGSREGEDRSYLNGKQDIHEADFEFQKRVRDNYLDSMAGAVNCTIVPCAIQFGPTNEWIVYTPDELFKRYKPVLDYTLFNTPIL
jgi:dTMP kinase